MLHEWRNNRNTLCWHVKGSVGKLPDGLCILTEWICENTCKQRNSWTKKQMQVIYTENDALQRTEYRKDLFHTYSRRVICKDWSKVLWKWCCTHFTSSLLELSPVLPSCTLVQVHYHTQTQTHLVAVCPWWITAISIKRLLRLHTGAHRRILCRPTHMLITADLPEVECDAGL